MLSAAAQRAALGACFGTVKRVIRLEEKKEVRQSVRDRRKCYRGQDNFSVWLPSTLGKEILSKLLQCVSPTTLRMCSTTIRGRQKRSTLMEAGGKLKAGKWYRLAAWDIGRDGERQWMRDFAQNLEGERRTGSKSD